VLAKNAAGDENRTRTVINAKMRQERSNSVRVIRLQKLRESGKIS
jgi:hypothetical protein